MAIHQAIYKRLKECARRGELINYSEIAPLADLNMEKQADRTQMGELLGEISTNELENGRPMLSAIVVLKESAIPGEGFFNLARYLGVYHGHGDDTDVEFFALEVNKVFTFWENSIEP